MRVCQIGNFGPVNSTENDLMHALVSLGVGVEFIQEDDWVAGKVALPPPDGFDLLLWTHTPGYGTSEHVGQLSVWEHVPKVGYHLDRWSGLRRAASVWTDPYWEWLDWWFTADPAVWMWERLGLRTVWTPPAVSTRWLDDVTDGEPWQNTRLPDPRKSVPDVIFVGNETRPSSMQDPNGYHIEHTHRPHMLEQLKKRYGDRFQSLQPARTERIHPRDLSILYHHAPVIVGDSCLAGVDAYWSDRIPETIGRGGLLVHPQTDWRDCFDPGSHLLVYGAWGWDEMAHWIDLALDAPDHLSAMRMRGRAHVLAHHTYTERMRRMLEVVL